MKRVISLHHGLPCAFARCLVTGLLFWLVWPANAQAPDAGEFSPERIFEAPQTFFEQFFGAQPAENNALAKIQVSVQQEQAFGTAAVESYLQQLSRQGIRVVSRGRDAAYLRELAECLKPHMQNHARYRTLRIWVAQSPVSDARSFPGGNLVFFEGLLDYCPNEAALAGIVGHELSHLDRQHQLLSIKRAKLAQDAFSGQGGFDFSRMMSAGAEMSKIWLQPFRPSDEEEADRDGATWAWQAGYDPQALADLFLHMHQQQDDRGQHSQAGTQPAFFRTHPFHLDRYRKTDDLCRQLKQNDQKLYLGRANLERRIAKSQRMFPE